jgi:hypothetical protein
MGRQGSGCNFVGSCLGINGYIDDGKPIWRKRSSLDKAGWLKHPNMGAQRAAAGYFGAANTIARFLWMGLPLAMRRIGDAGAYNRIVGTCRVLLDDEGQLSDLDGLRNLDLNEESSGSLRVASLGVDSLGVDSSQLIPILGNSLGGSVSGSVSEEGLRERLREGLEKIRIPYSCRLVGLDRLFDELDLAESATGGAKPGHFVVAHKHLLDGVARTPFNWFPDDGSCDGWGKQNSRNSRNSQDFQDGLGDGLADGACAGHTKARHDVPLRRPERRVRVWVWASSVVETAWDAKRKSFGLKAGSPRDFTGFVSDWLVFKGQDVAPSYVVQGGELEFPALCEGLDYVVFTAVEVSEKRGKHWVRLPWVSRMRVSDSIASSELEMSNEKLEMSVGELAQRVVLVEEAEELAGSGEQLAVVGRDHCLDFDSFDFDDSGGVVEEQNCLRRSEDSQNSQNFQDSEVVLVEDHCLNYDSFDFRDFDDSGGVVEVLEGDVPLDGGCDESLVVSREDPPSAGSSLVYFDGLFEGDLVEVKASWVGEALGRCLGDAMNRVCTGILGLGGNGQVSTCPYQAGELVRAGP